MKKLLRELLAFAERKWPDQVVVTQKDYDALVARIKYLESEVTKFNASLGFMGIRGKAGAFANDQGSGVGAGPFQR